MDETRYLSQPQLTDDFVSDNAAAGANRSSNNIIGEQNDNELFFDCMGRTAGMSDNTSGIMLQVPSSPTAAPGRSD